jgi:hypothetical protein
MRSKAERWMKLGKVVFIAERKDLFSVKRWFRPGQKKRWQRRWDLTLVNLNKMEGALNQRPLGNDSSKPGQGDALNQRVLAEKGKGLELETGSGTVGGMCKGRMKVT